MPEHDLILSGGRIIDPAQGIDRVADIAFTDGRVAAIGNDLGAARDRRDVSGKLVTPGLIEMHTHVYWGGTSLGIDAADFARVSGVTTAVDTGSAGPGNFAGFRAHVIEPAETRILAYLHISHAGIFGFSDRIMVGESEDIRLMDPITAAEVANANRDVIVGIKVRLGRHASGIHGMTPLDYALAAAEATGLPLMVHIDEPPPSYTAVVERLRDGDVLTHCFRPFPNTPIGPGDRIRAEVLAARQRGVMFDVGHGMGSFSFDIAEKALADGFTPDTISSDIHQLCINGPAFDQVTTLSKFLALGMPLAEVIRASTENAARALSRPDLGNFRPGSVGDAAILRLDEGRHQFADVLGVTKTGHQRLFCEGVVLGGAWWHPK